MSQGDIIFLCVFALVGVTAMLVYNDLFMGTLAWLKEIIEILTPFLFGYGAGYSVGHWQKNKRDE